MGNESGRVRRPAKAGQERRASGPNGTGGGRVAGLSRKLWARGAKGGTASVAVGCQGRDSKRGCGKNPSTRRGAAIGNRQEAHTIERGRWSCEKEPRAKACRPGDGGQPRGERVFAVEAEPSPSTCRAKADASSGAAGKGLTRATRMRDELGERGPGRGLDQGEERMPRWRAFCSEKSGLSDSKNAEGKGEKSRENCLAQLVL